MIPIPRFKLTPLLKLFSKGVLVGWFFIATTQTMAQEQHPSREPLSLYRESYLLWSYDRSSLNKGAVMKFQLSIKIITFLKGLYIGYTQRSFMDLIEDSFPFYDHNFSPEVFYRPPWVKSDLFEYIQTGLLHESNGLNADTSRSWNRIYLETLLRLKSFYLRPMLWLPFLIEDTGDMKKYYGFGEAEAGFINRKNIEASLRGRVGEGFNKGSLMFNFSLPFSAFTKKNVETSYAQLWFQTWYGHGETLLGLSEKSLAFSAGIGMRPKVINDK